MSLLTCRHLSVSYDGKAVLSEIKIIIVQNSHKSKNNHFYQNNRLLFYM